MQEVIELPNIPSEYEYITKLTCEFCNGSLKGEREGSRLNNDGKRMLDFWTVTCTKCSKSKEIVLSVPTIDIDDLFGKNNLK